jgi:hypothetical protein
LNDEVVAILNEKFIPYAPGWGELEIATDNPKGKREPYTWWQDVARGNKPTPNGVSFNEAEIPGTMFWVATSAGQRVGAQAACRALAKANKGNFSLAASLQVFLQTYSKMPEAERRPAVPISDAHRAKLAPPPGGVCLISYDKPLRRNDDASYYCLTGPEQRTNLKQNIAWQPGAQLDALWLTKEECESLMPTNPKEGQTFAVSSHLVKRIGLFGLTVRSASQEFFFWKYPDSVRQGDLKLTVESVSPTAVRMRLHGSILLTAKGNQIEGHIREADLPNLQNRYDARLEGKLDYDPSRKRFTRWDMVALGDYTGACCACEFGKNKEEGHLVAREPLPIAMSFELENYNYEMPPEYRRTIPYLMWWFRGRPNHDFYFSPETWEADWIKRGKK